MTHKYDQGAYTVLLFDNIGRKGGNRPCYWLCRVLHLVDKDHCEKNVEASA